MFTVHVGPVGSGKTYSMVRAAMEAFEAGEPVFTNMDIDPAAAGWDHSTGGRIVSWYYPRD